MTAAPLPAPPSKTAPPSKLEVFASVGRVHIVAIAALATLTFGWLFTGRYPWRLAAICALDWLLVNVQNRVADLREDRANGVPGTDFVARHARLIGGAAFAVLFVSLVVVHRRLPSITLIRVSFHALGLAYSWPLLPGHVRIKELYFWKNVAPAIGFLQTCFAYPLAGAHGELASGVTWGCVVVTGVFFVLFELSYEVTYDLRDARGDRAVGVLTYPVVHGEARAVHVIDGLCVASIAALVVGFALRLVPWRIAVMAVAPLLHLVLYKRWLNRGITSSDCVRLTWIGTGLLVAYHLWVVAGLPGVGG
jgi:4-hydroxybenzoate polyprenyltransferase